MESVCSKIKNLNDLSTFSEDAIDFASANGMMMLVKNQPIKSKMSVHMPFTLFPSPIPKSSFDLLYDLQPSINKLMYDVSRDEQFMSSALKSVVDVDDFTRNLFEIYKNSKTSKFKSNYVFGIFRSDYMFNCKINDEKVEQLSPKQIEVNVIASSMAGVGTQLITANHTRVLKQANINYELPSNGGLCGVAGGLCAAWGAYGSSSAIIVFLVGSIELNLYDQRNLEYEINANNKDIVIKRKVFDDVMDGIEILEDGRLIIDREEVAVIYYRHGYMPEHYLTQKHWEARSLMEGSLAINCPNVAIQLVGCKKMQEVLAQPGMLEKFIKDDSVVMAMRKTFAGFYTLEMNSEGDAAVKMVRNKPEDFVLKPQREGGGNNFYGDDIIRVLDEIGNDDRRCAYIIMERIRPKPIENYIVSQGKFTKVDAVSEFGVYGVFLANGNTVVENYAAGHLLRSKSIEHDDGGVAAGVAVLDSALLV